MKDIIYYSFCPNSDNTIGVLQENVEFPNDGEVVTDWETPALELVDGGYGPYLFGPQGTNVVSEELKAVLESYDYDEDMLKFLPVDVVSEEHGNRRYYLVHFNFRPDVIDEAITRYVPGTDSIIKVGLDYRKVKYLDAFPSKPYGNNLTVSGRVRAEMKKRKLLKGITFLPLYCSHTENV